MLTAEELKQYRAGFNRVFPKPFERGRLFEVVDVLVN
jgi:hypothetical protein